MPGNIESQKTSSVIPQVKSVKISGIEVFVRKDVNMLLRSSNLNIDPNIAKSITQETEAKSLPQNQTVSKRLLQDSAPYPLENMRLVFHHIKHLPREDYLYQQYKKSLLCFILDGNILGVPKYIDLIRKFEDGKFLYLAVCAQKIYTDSNIRWTDMGNAFIKFRSELDGGKKANEFNSEVESFLPHLRRSSFTLIS